MPNKNSDSSKVFFENSVIKNTTISYIKSDLENKLSLMKLFDTNNNAELDRVINHLEEAIYQIKLYLEKNQPNNQPNN